MKILLEASTPSREGLAGFLADTALAEADEIILRAEEGLSPFVAAPLIRERLGKEVSLFLSCRDRNRIALFSDIESAAHLGFARIILGYGAYPTLTAQPDARPVYDLDPVHLLQMRKDAEGPFAGPKDARPPMGILAQAASPLELKRLESYLSTGADFLVIKRLAGIEEALALSDKPVYAYLERSRREDIEQARARGARWGLAGLCIAQENPAATQAGNTDTV